MEGNEIVVQESGRLVSTVDEMVSHVQFIQNVMARIMQKDQHYGVIPGCGDKPTLLKPGAEKILEAFRLAADPIVEDLSTEDQIRYRVKVRITHQVTGAFIGAGIGECSSDEEKYKWRYAISDEEFNVTPENRRRLKYKKGWNGKADEKIKQIRTNPADVANTILKMAKKRGLVDGALTVTSASDIFAQDIEEMDPIPEESKPRQSQPRQESKVSSATTKSNLAEIKDWLFIMDNADTATMAEHLKRITSYTNKKGEQAWAQLDRLDSIAERLPNWIETIHRKLSSEFDKFQGKPQ